MSDMARCAKCQMLRRNPDAFPTDVETIGLCYDVRLDPSRDHALESIVASRRLPLNGRPGFIALKKWLNDPKT
jgi:hypothetical protein